MSLLSLCAVLVAVFAGTERPVLDYLDEYKVLHYLEDQKTGKVIELGVLSNFGSIEYEVGVYDEVNPKRTSFGLRPHLISVVGSPGPDPAVVQFDGACYFMVSAFRPDWDKVHPQWTDNVTGKQLCFYVLTPDGDRID